MPKAMPHLVNSCSLEIKGWKPVFIKIRQLLFISQERYGRIWSSCGLPQQGDPADGEEAAGDAQGVQEDAGDPQDGVDAGPGLQPAAAFCQDGAGEDGLGLGAGAAEIVINDVGCHKSASVRRCFSLSPV